MGGFIPFTILPKSEEPAAVNAQTIMICSGKGGTGKSTISVLLGAELGRRGKRVLLI